MLGVEAVLAAQGSVYNLKLTMMRCLCVCLLQGCEIGQQAFCLMSPTQRPYELGDGSKTGNLLTMFLTGPLMAFCLASGNTDPSIQQLVDLQVRVPAAQATLV